MDQRLVSLCRRICFCLAIVVVALLFSISQVSAANNVTRIENGGSIKYKKLTFKLKNGKLTYTVGKKKKNYVVGENVSIAFFNKDRIAFKDDIGIELYNIDDKALAKVVPNKPSDYQASDSDTINLVGFYDDEMLYMCGSRGKFIIWATNLKTGIVSYPVGIGGYSVTKAYNNGKYVYIKPTGPSANSQELLIRYDLSKQDYDILTSTAVTAYVNEKYAYYLEYTSDTMKFTRKGDLNLVKCDTNGKNKKSVATIKNVSLDAYIFITEKYVYYTNTDGKMIQYTIKNGKTKTVDISTYESPIFNENSLY